MTGKLKRTAVFLASALAMICATELAAHEGHDHKAMGTVASVHEKHLEVKATDGKTITFVVDADTRIIRDQTPIKLADVDVGARVVVTYRQEKGASIAKEVRVGVSSRGAAGKP